MASRLPYRSKADLERRLRVAERQRNLRRSRSEKIVTNSAAFQEVAVGSDVIGHGYVTESQVGDGLGTPYLEMPLQPVATTPATALTCGPYGWERASTAAAFETVFAYIGVQQNVLWAPRFVLQASDTSTAAELQAVDLATGLPLIVFGGTPWLAVHIAGSTAAVEHEPAGGLLLPGQWGDELHFGVQVRRTTGAGTVTVSVTKSIGG